jgi:hypothetical protein
MPRASGLGTKLRSLPRERIRRLMLKLMKASAELAIISVIVSFVLLWYLLHTYGPYLIVIVALLVVLHVRKGKVEARKVEEVPPVALDDPRVEEFRKFLKQIDGVGNGRK